ncbi:UDP-N-acetylmuramoyl-L-alanyl-D-glutamate--2,6-diaminopimelate ligase [Patescibacteria group bacterium]|nr:UDP-N-acetylmuramoyl-L-alanyl-D-glutamate--2,6-diaminopimelate ligase [Patescibacteria group bacterium]
MSIKSLVRKLIPEPILSLYHLSLAKLAEFWYGHPSEKLIVIGITGTNGKSSTVQFLGQILEAAGHKVGWTSTASFKVADKLWGNDKKMTMLGRFQTQRLLKEMVAAGCEYAIVETSSQGISQYRHAGINYDVAAITNLTPEHIEAHGGFENYQKAKGKLFAHTAAGQRKTLGTKNIEKISVVNIDDEHADYFLKFELDKRYGFGLADKKYEELAHKRKFIPVVAKNLQIKAAGSEFAVEGVEFKLKPLGKFNVQNVLAAITMARALGLDWAAIRQGVKAIEPVPGRMETVDQGQDFSVIVDYAYEPAALAAVYETVKLMKPKRIIHVTGSAGGGRDAARRAVIGRLAAKHDDIVIVTNEDPYDEDPILIINAVAEAAVKAGKQDDQDLFRVLDRQEAIDLAVSLARKDDLVLITGKGSEPVMAVANDKKIPWDDRTAAKKAIKKI